MKRELVQKLREFCPNIRIVEKAIAWCRKCQLTHGSLSSKKVKEAEKSLRIKKKVVAKYKNRRKLEKIDGQIQSLFDTAPQYVNESATRLDNIREDMKFCFIAYGFTPYEYLCLDLEGNDYDYRKTFISSRDQHIYQAVVNNVIDSAVLIDKSKTYEKFTKFYRRDAITLTDAEDLESFFSFIEKHSIFVTKPVYSGLGKGIQRIDSSTYSDNIRELFDNILNKGKTLVEEILIQGNIMGSFNADSVNTVRVVTMSTRGGGLKIVYSFLRTGREGSFVDNGGSMGVFANVDPETGLVITDGYDEHNVCYQTHPDSGVQFKGFQLPEWNNLLNIITECANKLTTLKSVSWDMAYAASKEYPEFAWTIVETNPMGDFLNQIAGKKGFKKEMEEYIRQTDTSIRL